MKSSTSNASSSTGRASHTHDGSASATGSKGSSDDGSGVVRTRVQRPHDPNRPNFSYSALIGQAILSTGNKRMRLAEIYDYVTANCKLLARFLFSKPLSFSSLIRYSSLLR